MKMIVTDPQKAVLAHLYRNSGSSFLDIRIAVGGSQEVATQTIARLLESKEIVALRRFGEVRYWLSRRSPQLTPEQQSVLRCLGVAKSAIAIQNRVPEADSLLLKQMMGQGLIAPRYAAKSRDVVYQAIGGAI